MAKRANKEKIHMNKIIAKAGAAMVVITVAIFAVCMLIHFSFGSYLVCMFLALGFLMMMAGFAEESDKDSKVASMVAMAAAVMYAILIFLVYFAQTTVVSLGLLTDREAVFLDFSRSGLIFYYDLLGYGMMALSTFFTGLTIKTQGKADRCLRYLMMIHGVFFFACLFMPMLGVFLPVEAGEMGIGGVIALEFWCAYFLTIGVLSYLHFNKGSVD